MNWRDHHWARGYRIQTLEAMGSDEERWAWLRRREDDDRMYVEWRRRWEPDYVHPWPVSGVDGAAL